MKKKKPLVLLVDGVDLVRDGRGQLSSDWMPQQLSQVSYVDGERCTIITEMHLFHLSKIDVFSN